MTPVHDFLAFLDASPSPFHAVLNSRLLLEQAGFREIDESGEWPTSAGKYFVVRAGSLIAWIEPESVSTDAGFRILGAHTDSPNLRVKQEHDIYTHNSSVVALEPYGSPILPTWFDRDLGIAGRLVLSDLSEHLVLVREPLLRVPNLAIHLDREKSQPNPQTHLNAIWSASERSFLGYVAEHAGLDPAAVVGFDLMAFDNTLATFMGVDEQFISGPRLDNLATVWSGLHALISSSGQLRNVLAIFDHEEVGSQSERGAASPFLESVLERIVLGRGGDREIWRRAMAQSIVISGDMAHGTHPNYADKHEPLHRVQLGGGPVLKVHTNLRYATDARGAGFFSQACREAGVPMQRFMSRADMPCGSTIGPISASQTGILTVDVGAPQLAMHSAREFMVRADLQMYASALTACLEIRGFTG